MTRDRLIRAYATELEGDGRTVFGQCVPYNVPATVRDKDGPTYVEVFAAGAFRRLMADPARVDFTYEHPEARGGGTVYDRLGRSVEFDDRMTGLWGGFRVVESNLGDHVLALVREGVIGALSIGFEPVSQKRGPHGEVIRTRCRLVEVSLVRQPAYESATVEMVRSATVIELDQFRPRPNPELDARLAALVKPQTTE